MGQGTSRIIAVRRALCAVFAASAFAIFSFSSPALGASFAANAGSLGEIPDSPAGGNTCGDFSGAARDVTFTVTGLTGSIADVSAGFTSAFISGGGGPGHSWVGDLDVRLIGPGGSPSQTLISQTGSTTATGCGDGSNASGPYTFSDNAPSSPTWFGAAATVTDAAAIPPGSYRAATPGGVVGGGANTLITPTFAGLANPNGTWTLRFRDGGQGDIGSVTAATLSIVTNPTSTLTVAKDGTGSGTVTGGGIDCGPTCILAYVSGTPVELTAAADAGSTFSAWSGCDSVVGAKCTVTMTASRTATASFAKSATGTTGPATTPTTTQARRKDTIAPSTAIGKHPPKETAKHKAKFTFSANEAGSRFECKLDKAAYAACVSPFKKKVGTGKHTFKVLAIDTAGNADPTPAKVKFTVTP